MIPEILWRGDLVVTQSGPFAAAYPNTMLACRHCRWAMVRFFGWWICENARLWNFWRHDVLRRTPTFRSPCM